MFDNEHYSLGRISPARLLTPFLFPENPDLKPDKRVYLPIFVISAIATRMIPYIHTFSFPLAYALLRGLSPTRKATKDDLSHAIRARSLVIIGTSIGKMLSHSTQYSWKTPIHFSNICTGLTSLMISYLNIHLDALSDLEFTPIQLQLKGKAENFQALKVRVEELKKQTFKFDKEIKEDADQKLAAHYILLADEGWTRAKKKNYMALTLCSHHDKNPGIDDQYANWVLRCSANPWSQLRRPFINEVGDETAPTGLVGSAKASTTIAVIMLIEENVVAEVRVGLNPVQRAVNGALVISIELKEIDQSLSIGASHLFKIGSLDLNEIA